MADNPFLAAANPMQLMQQAQQLPPELQPDLRDVTRQQQLANMLTQQSFQQPQGQMVSGRYVAPSFFQNVLPLAQAYFGKSMAEEADTKQAQLAQRLRDIQAKEAQQYGEAMGGVAANPETGAPAVAPNPRRAFEIALNSNVPALRAQALEMLKGQKVGADETIQRMNLGTGQMETIAAGPTKTPDTIKTAAITLGLPPDPKSWTAQQAQAVNNQVIALKRAGANVFSPTISMGKDISPIVAKFIETSGEAAKQGVLNIDAADKLLTSINEGKIFVGPTASWRQGGAQLADIMGVGGKGTEEKLLNTRMALQGLAQMWMGGRQQMKGQGQVTEGENALAGKIQSGEIDKLTIPEIKYLAENVKKMGNYYIKDYENKLEEMKKNPETAPYVPFMKVSPLPSTVQNTPKNSNVINQADEILKGGK